MLYYGSFNSLEQIGIQSVHPDTCTIKKQRPTAVPQMDLSCVSASVFLVLWLSSIWPSADIAQTFSWVRFGSSYHLIPSSEVSEGKVYIDTQQKPVFMSTVGKTQERSLFSLVLSTHSLGKIQIFTFLLSYIFTTSFYLPDISGPFEMQWLGLLSMYLPIVLTQKVSTDILALWYKILFYKGILILVRRSPETTAFKIPSNEI